MWLTMLRKGMRLEMTLFETDLFKGRVFAETGTTGAPAAVLFLQENQRETPYNRRWCVRSCVQCVGVRYLLSFTRCSDDVVAWMGCSCPHEQLFMCQSAGYGRSWQELSVRQLGCFPIGRWSTVGVVLIRKARPCHPAALITGKNNQHPRPTSHVTTRRPGLMAFRSARLVGANARAGAALLNAQRRGIPRVLAPLWAEASPRPRRVASTPLTFPDQLARGILLS